MRKLLLLALMGSVLSVSAAPPAARPAPALAPVNTLFLSPTTVAVARIAADVAPECLQVVANDCPARISCYLSSREPVTVAAPAGPSVPVGDWCPALPALATGLGAPWHAAYLHRINAIRTFRKVRYRYYRRRQQAPATHSPLGFWSSRQVIVSYCISLTSPALPPTVAVLPL